MVFCESGWALCWFEHFKLPYMQSNSFSQLEIYIIALCTACCNVCNLWFYFSLLILDFSQIINIQFRIIIISHMNFFYSSFAPFYTNVLWINIWAWEKRWLKIFIVLRKCCLNTCIKCLHILFILICINFSLFYCCSNSRSQFHFHQQIHFLFCFFFYSVFFMLCDLMTQQILFCVCFIHNKKKYCNAM